MTIFDDLIMDFLFENDAPESPTGELYLAALAAMPDHTSEVRSYFETWVWIDWCDDNLPPAPEPTEEEERAMEARIDAAVAKIMASFPAQN